MCIRDRVRTSTQKMGLGKRLTHTQPDEASTTLPKCLKKRGADVSLTAAEEQLLKDATDEVKIVLQKYLDSV